MSAENAWRIAMEAATSSAAYTDYPRAAPTNEEASAYDDMAGRIADNLQVLPMPPAFRAAVEAETEELRGMLAEATSELKRAREWAWSADRKRIDALLSRLEAKGEEKP